MSLIEGVDISHHQGAIDWRRVRAAGITFAFIKSSEGDSFRDSRFADNIVRATDAGIAVGPYHFARPNDNSPEAEAAHFVGVIRGFEYDLPPVLDLEVGSGPLGRWAERFLSEVEEILGITPGVYLSPGWWNGHRSDVAERSSTSKLLARSPLWTAHWTDAAEPTVPWPWKDWTWWQYTSKGRVDGIAGNVDLNRANPSLATPKEDTDMYVLHPDGGVWHVVGERRVKIDSGRNWAALQKRGAVATPIPAGDEFWTYFPEAPELKQTTDVSKVVAEAVAEIVSRLKGTR